MRNFVLNPYIFFSKNREHLTIQKRGLDHHWECMRHRCSMVTFSFSLTDLPPDKIAAFSQTIFSDAFSWMNSFVNWLNFHWILFLRVQLTIITGLDNGLAPKRRQTNIWTKAEPINWRIYAALRGNELKERIRYIEIYINVIHHFINTF